MSYHMSSWEPAYQKSLVSYVGNYLCAERQMTWLTSAIIIKLHHLEHQKNHKQVL
jgi:energy-converting hydrogenase Eha subunit B